jgi:hypothetical protein
MNILVAYVRKLGAIGIFYNHNFEVVADNLEAAKAEWFEKYHPEWDLNHFVRLETVVKE